MRCSVPSVPSSQHAARALETAFDEARLHGTSVLALHAFAVPLLAGAAPLAPIAYPQVLRADEEAEIVARALTGFRSRYPDVPVATRVMQGPAASGIVEAGRDARMVVLATHGRSGVDGVLHGSVTRGVLHHATCPVLVVR
jgi:nucleotide-binding universal stress UspA family protein